MTPDHELPDDDELRNLDDSLRFIGKELDDALQDDAARCGSYTLLSEIGEGGYGEIHLAVQDPPAERRVAIKILKRGLDTREILRRFSLEQRALARIDHPNVASILDAGTTADGRPWFAMPLLDGDAITLACDDAQLGLEDRVAILAAACDGVQAAHAQGIVHRDLKPSNIIVVRDGTGRVVPKVIDFGIAKALDMDEGSTHTAEIGRLGTPAYMAPEQLRAVNPWTDTRSDVYALGTILDELLTGAPRSESAMSGSGMPHRSASSRIADAEKSHGEWMRAAAIARGCPTPDALRRRLRGDLEAILAKATAEDPMDRYQSADALSADLRRWIEREPISARPPGVLLFARAFARRHFATVALGCAALVLVVGIAIVALIQSARARDQSLRAASAAERADEVSAALREVLAGLDAAAAGGRDRQLIIGLLDAAAARHEQSQQRLDALSSAEISAVLGDAYVSVDLPDKALDLADHALRRLEASEQLALSPYADGVAIATARLLTLRGDAIARKGGGEGFIQLFGIDESAYDAWARALLLLDKSGASGSRTAIRCKIRFWSNDRSSPLGDEPGTLRAELGKQVELLDDRDQLKWVFYLRRAEMNTFVEIFRTFPGEIERASAALGDLHLLVLRSRVRLLALRLFATIESIANQRDGIPTYDDSGRQEVWRGIVGDGTKLAEDIGIAIGSDHQLALAARFWTCVALGYLSGPEAARSSFDALRIDVLRLSGPNSQSIRQLQSAWRGIESGPGSSRWW